MKNKNPAKKPPTKKIRLQIIFSVILVWQLVSIISYTWKLVAEENRDELGLQADLNRGQYAACAHFYDMYRSQGKTTGKEFDKFQEFSDFYDLYILCVEYQGARENLTYEENMRECMDEMNRIREDTPYPDLIPHYEYLIQLLENMEAIKE